MMILLYIGIGVLIYTFFKDRGSFTSSEPKQDASELLKERYVKGEIDEATYLQMKEHIK